MFPAANTSCYSLFLFIVPFHFSFHTYLLYKKVWAFVGQIILTRSKGSWAQFVFIYRSHSAEELYFTANLYSATDLYSAADLRFAVYCFPLYFFLWTFLTLQSSWWVFRSCFSLGFFPHGMDSKMGINRHKPIYTND